VAQTWMLGTCIRKRFHIGYNAWGWRFWRLHWRGWKAI